MIYKRPGSRYYWYEFLYRGQRVRESAKTTNRRTARDIESAHRLRLAKGDAGIVARTAAPTLALFAPRFLADVKLRRPKSERFYAQQVSYLLSFPVLAVAPLDAIRPELIARYRAWRRKTVGIATTNRALATLRRMLRLAAEWELITAAPKVQLLPGERPRDFVLSPDRELDYVEAFPEPMRTAVIVMIETGLRPGEALRLKWTDVNTAKAARMAYVRVRAEIAKRGTERVVPLTDRALGAILALPRADADIFGRLASRNGINRLQKRNRKIRDKLGLGAVVPHSMRHTALTRLGAAGADAFTIAKLAGHASIATTQRYVHPADETIERAVRAAEAMRDLAPHSPAHSEQKQPPVSRGLALVTRGKRKA